MLDTSETIYNSIFQFRCLTNLSSNIIENKWTVSNKIRTNKQITSNSTNKYNSSKIQMK